MRSKTNIDYAKIGDNISQKISLIKEFDYFVNFLKDHPNDYEELTEGFQFQKKTFKQAFEDLQIEIHKIIEFDDKFLNKKIEGTREETKQIVQLNSSLKEASRKIYSFYHRLCESRTDYFFEMLKACYTKKSKMVETFAAGHGRSKTEACSPR